MQSLKEYMVNESSEFSSMENNPLIYILVIPKVLNGDVDVIKKDEIIKNVIGVTEKFIKDNLDANTIKVLKNAYRPASVMDVFKLSKNYKATFDNYMADLKSIVCNEETNFMKAINISKKFDELLSSPEYQLYKNTL
jgi:hypothetical protein